MALPVINESPKYKLTIPSSGEKVFFRPFLVKEQKILLMAMESKEHDLILKAMVDTIMSCIDSNIRPEDLATFDVEYIFTQIRSKSVGETAEIGLRCTECDATNEVRVNLEEIKIEKPKMIQDIQLTDKFVLKLRYPRYLSMVDSFKDNDSPLPSDMIFNTAIGCLDKLLTEEDVISFDDEPLEEKIKFLDNLNDGQFKKIMDFVRSIPKLQEEVRFVCSGCQHENHQLLQGIEDFF